MIPDLKYPEDARKALDGFLLGIAYDASVAISGITLSKMPVPGELPDFAVPIRCGGIETDQAIRRDPVLFSRFALISMISRFDVYVQHLLLERRVIEFLGGTAKKMDPKNLWRILKEVQRQSRSETLRCATEWL